MWLAPRPTTATIIVARSCFEQSHGEIQYHYRGLALISPTNQPAFFWHLSLIQPAKEPEGVSPRCVDAQDLAYKLTILKLSPYLAVMNDLEVDDAMLQSRWEVVHGSEGLAARLVESAQALLEDHVDNGVGRLLRSSVFQDEARKHC